LAGKPQTGGPIDARKWLAFAASKATQDKDKQQSQLASCAESQVHRKDTKWVGDITFVPTGEGWMYLAVVMDLTSRGMGDALAANW
jgi:transposase InsO family protein